MRAGDVMRGRGGWNLQHLMPVTSPRSWFRPLLEIVYLIALTALLFLAFSHWSYDDPFITYRYASNLERGLGFVYNPGEQILSTTTPLFALLLALLGNFWSDLPQLAVLIGSASLALGAIFLRNLANTWNAPWVGWSGLLLYPTFPLLLSTLGSETPLYLALCLGSFSFYARRRYRATAVLAALAALARADAGLVVLVIGVDYVRQERSRIPWSAVLAFLAIALTWVIFAWVYFGSPLPATLLAKQHQGSMAISQRFLPGLWTMLQDYANWRYAGEAVLSVMGIWFMFRHARTWTILLVWVALYFIAYTFLGVSRYFWYYAPLVPLVIVAVGLGIDAFVGGPSATRFSPWLRMAPAILLLVFGSIQAVNLFEQARHPDTRLGIYRAIGEWLKSSTPTEASVGAFEVGIIGYYAERPMVDFAGLLQPDISGQLTSEATYEDAALWAVERYRPDYLVLYDSFFPRLENGFVAQRCYPVQRFSAPVYRYSADMSIYACR